MEGSREMLIDHPYKNVTKVKCLQPAIKQFPRTPWDKEERQNGWVSSYRSDATDKLPRNQFDYYQSHIYIPEGHICSSLAIFTFGGILSRNSITLCCMLGIFQK